MVTEQHAAGALDGSVDPEELTTLLAQENQALIANVEQLKAENAELQRILQLAVTLEGPLHAHTRHQIWDGSGKRCAWCVVYEEAQEFFSTQRQAITKEQP